MGPLLVSHSPAIWPNALMPWPALFAKPTQPEANAPDLDFEQIEMLANFSDYAADFPKLSFEDIAKEARPGFQQKPGMEKFGKKSAARTEGLLNRRGYSPLGF
jgi:hypothetical protein